jgi:hypothetical protein
VRRPFDLGGDLQPRGWRCVWKAKGEEEREEKGPVDLIRSVGNGAVAGLQGATWRLENFTGHPWTHGGGGASGWDTSLQEKGSLRSMSGI